MGLIATGVPLTHRKTKMTLTWRETGNTDRFYIFIVLCLFYKVLFYRYPTFISLFALATCGFQLGIGDMGVDMDITH